MSQRQTTGSPKDPNAEPSAGFSTVPIWLILIMGGLFYWGSMYLDGHAGAFSNQIFEPYGSQEALEAAQPYDPVRAKLAMGKDVFDKTCSTCHGPDGRGKTGQFPPLAGSDWLTAASATRIGRIVIRGLSGNIIVKANGETINLNASMAPLGDNYTDEQLAAALTFVRQSFGNNAPEITTEQIKAIRAQVADHPGSFSPDELLAKPLEPLK